MYRDDISRLYKYLGQPSQSYLDFQTEDDFRERINRVAIRRRNAAWPIGIPPVVSPLRQSKIIAVISAGHMPGRKLVASLAWIASRRLGEKVPVHVADLIPANNQQEEQTFLLSNGIRHILVDTSGQTARMEAAKEIAWLERQITADHDAGLIFMDVPECVMHARHHAMAAADMVLVLLPAAMSSVRAIEDVESELGETLLRDMAGKLRYLLVESKDFEGLCPRLQEELVSHRDLFVPVCLPAESFPGARELSAGLQLDSAEYRGLQDICNFIFGKIAHEDR